MGARDRVVDKAPKFRGQKSAQPLESYGIANAEYIKNFYLENGQLNKSNGCTTYQEVTAGSGGIKSIHRANEFLVLQKNDSIFLCPSTQELFTAIETYEGVPYDVNSTISSLLSSSPLRSTQWRDSAYLANGVDFFPVTYFNRGNSLPATDIGETVGLDPIETLSISVSWPVVGNVEDGSHYYMVAIYDASTNTESVCWGARASTDGLYETNPDALLGPVPFHVAAVGSARRFVLTLPIITNPKATHLIVYRSGPKVGDLYDTFYRVPQTNPSSSVNGGVLIPISENAVPFWDNTATADLPEISPPTNNSPPPTPTRLFAALTYAKANMGATESWVATDASGFKQVKTFRDQLFGIGARSYGFTITTEVALGADLRQKVTGKVAEFRDLLHGSEVYQPHYWPYRWEVGRGDGQDANGLGVLGDVALLVFKEGSTYYLSGSSPDSFVLRIMDTRRGCAATGSIQETPAGVITLDRSGFVLWNKIGQGTPLSEDIHDYIEEIQFQYADKFYSCYDPVKRLYRCSVVIPGSQNPNLTFVLSLDTMDWSLEQGGEGLSRLQFSVNANNFSSVLGVTVDVGKVYDYVGDPLDGKLYDYSLRTNVSNRGSAAIEAIWTSGTINFGDDQHKKRLNWIYLRAKSFGGWKVDIEVIPDYDESRKYVIEDWDVISSQSEWYSSDVATDGSLLWDDGRWASAGASRDVSKIPVKCIGYTFQIRIINKENDASRYAFSIESVSAEGCLLGR